MMLTFKRIVNKILSDFVSPHFEVNVETCMFSHSRYEHSSNDGSKDVGYFCTMLLYRHGVDGIDVDSNDIPFEKCRDYLKPSLRKCLESIGLGETVLIKVNDSGTYSVELYFYVPYALISDFVNFCKLKNKWKENTIPYLILRDDDYEQAAKDQTKNRNYS